MITPSEIKRKAKRQYHNFLRAILRRERFFPLAIKGNKGKANTPLEELFPQLRRLLEGEKKKLGYGYTVELKQVNTRHAGNISMPDHIFFAHVEDYLKFIEKEEEFLKFRKAVQLTQRQVPALMAWMEEHLMEVLKDLTDWENLLKVIIFFQKNPLPNAYSRALPIDVPAIFIEENQQILTELLNHVLPASAKRESDIFTKHFGLKTDEVLVEMRSLDKDIFTNFPNQITQLALPLSSAKTLSINAKTIFIITDKMNWLRFPQQVDSLAIYGATNLLIQLNKLPWLLQKMVYFWGDISLAGLLQLSKLRQFFPQTEVFLMDKKTLEKYVDLVETEKEKVDDISLLKAEEYELFLEL
ncbi:MAG: DUF3322 domain-containing protein, partial [Saprospiraceae bacterium]